MIQNNKEQAERKHFFSACSYFLFSILDCEFVDLASFDSC